jgi:hypothetical protein
VEEAAGGDATASVTMSMPLRAAAPQLSRLARAVVLVVYVVVTAAVLLPLTQYVVVPIASSGAPGADWSWNTVAAVIASSLAALVAFGWALHQTVNTQLDEEGMQVPGFGGRKLVRWSEVQRVSGRGLRIKLHTASRTVTVNPLCYVKPREVVPFLLRKVPVASARP